MISGGYIEHPKGDSLPLTRYNRTLRRHVQTTRNQNNSACPKDTSQNAPYHKKSKAPTQSLNHSIYEPNRISHEEVRLPKIRLKTPHVFITVLTRKPINPLQKHSHTRTLVHNTLTPPPFHSLLNRHHHARISLRTTMGSARGNPSPSFRVLASLSRTWYCRLV